VFGSAHVLKTWFLPQRQAWWIVVLGAAALYLPTLHDLFTGVWSTDEQGHGPIVLGLCVWLFWRLWPQIESLAGGVKPPGAASAPTEGPQAVGWAWGLLAFALLMYVFGRSQRILSAQTLSAVFALAAVLGLLRGPKALRVCAFPLFFMLFMVPLPAALVDAVTQPMKLAVSVVAANFMYALGYPVARSGVILQVGQYQLLVADACAGLHTLFTLEAMGLLYLNVVRHSSALRNVLLAMLVVPISFAANVLRVMVLSLITYHFGDAAGQGFLHGFAGIVLFLSALLLIMATDSLLRVLFVRSPPPAP
jgi:exosortase B